MNLNRTWFTADTHFNHALMQHGYRTEYEDVEEMNEGIIKTWNSLVKPDDDVYHLGDFAWKYPEQFVDRLKGRIHLILGNHDRLKAWQKEMFASVQDVLWLSPKSQRHGPGIFLSHYPHRSWRNKEYGSIHLHGHCHGSMPDYYRSTDVGWDRHNMPVPLDILIASMKDIDPK